MIFHNSETVLTTIRLASTHAWAKLCACKTLGEFCVDFHTTMHHTFTLQISNIHDSTRKWMRKILSQIYADLNWYINLISFYSPCALSQILPEVKSLHIKESEALGSLKGLFCHWPTSNQDFANASIYPLRLRHLPPTRCCDFHLFC